MKSYLYNSEFEKLKTCNGFKDGDITLNLKDKRTGAYGHLNIIKNLYLKKDGKWRGTLYFEKLYPLYQGSESGVLGSNDVVIGNVYELNDKKCLSEQEQELLDIINLTKSLSEKRYSYIDSFGNRKHENKCC